MSCLAAHDQLPGLLAFIDSACADAALDEEVCFAMRLGCEEACINIIDHAYEGREPGPVSLSFRCDGAQAVLSIEDKAPFFAPGDAPPPDLTSDLDSRPLGGLGWHLIKQVMDEVRHEQAPGGGNRLELVKRLRLHSKV